MRGGQEGLRGDSGERGPKRQPGRGPRKPTQRNRVALEPDRSKEGCEAVFWVGQKASSLEDGGTPSLQRPNRRSCRLWDFWKAALRGLDLPQGTVCTSKDSEQESFSLQFVIILSPIFGNKICTVNDPSRKSFAIFFKPTTALLFQA